VTFGLGGCCLLVLVVDQGAKALALAQAREGRVSFLAGLIRVRLTSDLEIADRRGRCAALAVVWALAAAASILSLELSLLFHDRITSVGLGLALGGAASNLADRIFRGGVVDLVDVRVWPVFNAADVAIVAGLALALVPF